MAEEHCVLQRSRQMWWKGSLGSPVAAGWDWAFLSWLLSWLRLSLGVRQSCPWTPGKIQAQAVSESIRSSVCPVFASCFFPPLASAALARCVPGGISWTLSFAKVCSVKELSQVFPCIISWIALSLFMQIKHVKCDYRFLSLDGILTSGWICGIMEINYHTWANPWEVCNEPALCIFKLMPRSSSCWMFFHFPLARWSNLILVLVVDCTWNKCTCDMNSYLISCFTSFLFEDTRSSFDTVLPSLLMW